MPIINLQTMTSNVGKSLELTERKEQKLYIFKFDVL